MQISTSGLDLIKFFEGYANKAYEDTGGVMTIGWGTTRYPDGTRVKEGDTCTIEEAQRYLLHDVQDSVNVINKAHWDVPLRQNQFDALVSFQYNTGHLIGSTLYKKASVRPDDPTICEYDRERPLDSCEFTRWVRDNGRIIKGLIARRMREADLYSL